MAFRGQPHTLESLRSSGGGGGPRGPPQQRSVWLQGQQQLRFESDYKQRSYIELDYEQHSYVENLGAVQDESRIYQAPEYSGGLDKGAAYRPLYSQDELMDEGYYEHPQHMRSYASVVMQPMLLAWVEYAQYTHPVDEIEHVGKCKAPVFEEPMVEPKQARAPLQHPQELVWAPACTVARLPLRPLKLVSGESTLRLVRTDPVPMHQVQELDILAEPLAELLLEASDQIMSDAPAVQQEQRSE
ncbi:hypothetical protein C0995_012073, partial [Termitomyces sp. Mi166